MAQYTDRLCFAPGILGDRKSELQKIYELLNLIATHPYKIYMSISGTTLRINISYLNGVCTWLFGGLMKEKVD